MGICWRYREKINRNFGRVYVGFPISYGTAKRERSYLINVLEKILKEIEEKFKTADAEKCDCEELCDVEDWYDSGYIDGQLSAHEKCMDIIRSHMDEAKDTNAPSNASWIPVEERLPESDGFYLATLDGEICGQKEAFTGLAEFEHGKWIDDEEGYKCVLAWKPLPEPYKESEHD